jgi:hypothetical protein
MRPRYRDLPRWLLIERRDALSQSKECRSSEENFGIVAERPRDVSSTPTKSCPDGREQGPRMADRLGPATRAHDFAQRRPRYNFFAKTL